MIHLANAGLELPVDRLQKHVLILDGVLRVKHLLQGLVVRLLGVEGQLLKLLLVLRIVEHRLRQNKVRRD